MFETRNLAAATALATAAFWLASPDALANPESGRVGAESMDTAGNASDASSLTYPELEAQVAEYRQYHAEEDLLTCLRKAKSDPEIRGTHKVGPRLKQLAVQQRRYAEFREADPGLGTEERRRVERKIIELHQQQRKHIEFVRGLFANGVATTDSALLEYHDTGCIRGLESIVEDIQKSRESTRNPATPSGVAP